MLVFLMDDEVRKPRTVKIKPSVMRKVHHAAIDSQKTIGKWLEEAINQKLTEEGKEIQLKQ